MIPTEIISLFGGALTGFVFRFMAVRAEAEKNRFDRMMQTIDKKDESADKAAARDGDTGKVVRRFIVVTVMFSLVASPFIMAILGIPTYIEVPFIEKGFLGLTSDITRTSFVQITGNLITAEVRQTLIAITGFYFGSATASNKS